MDRVAITFGSPAHEHANLLRNTAEPLGMPACRVSHQQGSRSPVRRPALDEQPLQTPRVAQTTGFNQQPPFKVEQGKKAGMKTAQALDRIVGETDLGQVLPLAGQHVDERSPATGSTPKIQITFFILPAHARSDGAKAARPALGIGQYCAGSRSRGRSLNTASPSKGSLVCVGIGITLGSHISPLARSHIEQADVVFMGVSDGVVELWLQGMNKDARSLQRYYAEGKSRLETYQEMVDAMLTEVRAGKRVCGVFYGHPGVFAWAPHKAIEVARQEGYAAHMEPGISAEDCLYADLGIDPGSYGCQHFETSQFMLYKRRIDPSAWLILWQVGLAGDKTNRRFVTAPAYRQVLVDILARHYPLDHQVVLYQASTLSIEPPRIEWLALDALPLAVVGTVDTLAIPPARKMEIDPDVLARLDAMDREGAH
jgi:precorrin-6B methylase 1